MPFYRIIFFIKIPYNPLDAGSDDERSFKVKVSNLSADDSSQVNLDVEEVWGGGEELDTDSLDQANSDVSKRGDIIASSLFPQAHARN